MTRRTLALVAAYAVLTLAIVAAALTGYGIGSTAPQSAAQSSADITVMPCTAWANDARPNIPANTLTDACVDDAGTLHTAPTSMEKTR